MHIEHKIVRKNTAWVKDKSYPQAEVRFSTHGAQALIIVGLDGFEVKPYECRKGQYDYYIKGVRPHTVTAGKNIRFSTNAALQMTFSEWDQLYDYIKQVTNELVVLSH